MTDLEMKFFRAMLFALTSLRIQRENVLSRTSGFPAAAILITNLSNLGPFQALFVAML